MHASNFSATLGLLAFCIVAACADVPQTSQPGDADVKSEPAVMPASVTHFDAGAIIGEPAIVDCTLSGGTQTQCISITLNPEPASFEIGPWCPRNISDGPDMSGIWLEGGQVYDADGTFIQALPDFYNDDTWQLFDPATGKINVTDSKVACEAAARPDVDPKYQNHCVECLISYLPEGASQTYVLPITPTEPQATSSRVARAGVGITFSGAKLDGPAPTDAILSAHTLAPFDDCGGHINPNVGYHIHAVTDCLAEISVVKGHAAQIGLAMDGYPIHNRLNPDGVATEDLDACRGHSVEGIGYHYHVDEPGKNAIIGCHSGETGCVLDDASGSCDASKPTRRPPPPR